MARLRALPKPQICIAGGDFVGLTQKLHYIKGAQTRAVWKWGGVLGLLTEVRKGSELTLFCSRVVGLLVEVR